MADYLSHDKILAHYGTSYSLRPFGNHPCETTPVRGTEIKYIIWIDELLHVTANYNSRTGDNCHMHLNTGLFLRLGDDYVATLIKSPRLTHLLHMREMEISGCHERELILHFRNLTSETQEVWYKTPLAVLSIRYDGVDTDGYAEPKWVREAVPRKHNKGDEEFNELFGVGL